MASPRFAWGIDIGNRALKAVKLVRTAEGLRVDDFELIEHETVLSNAGDNREQLVQTALANFVQRHPMKGGAIAVGVSGQASFARFIKLPPVEPSKIPEIVRFEAIQQIPFPLDDVEWSYQLFQDPESPDVEVGIFAMRKELIDRYIKDFTDFELNVQVVQMNPLAVYNGLYQDSRFDGTTMVIDMGAENTDLIIADNETIWMRSIPIGGNNFTSTLEKAFKLPFAKAEELKRNAATSKYARQIFQAMRPNFADLVAEIQRSMGFYASVHKDSSIARVIALGATFRLPGLQKYLQQNLQLDIHGVDTLSTGSPADPKLAALFNENLRASVAAYGLAVQAMGDAKITSSLLPAAIRREKIWREKIKWFAASAALFVVGAGIGVARYSVQNIQYQQAEPVRNKITSVEKQASDLDTQWQTVADSGAPDRQQIQNVKALMSYRSLWRDMLLDISGSVPPAQPDVAAGVLSGDKDTIIKVPRNKRDVIYVDSIVSKFYGDLNPVLTDPDIRRFTLEVSKTSALLPDLSGGLMGVPGGAGGMPSDPGMPPPDPGMMAQPTPTPGPVAGGAIVPTRGGVGSRGFVVTFRCTSPSDDAANLINGAFINNLMNIWPSEKRQHLEYGVARATMTTANKIEADPTRMAKLKAQYDFAMQAKKMADQAAEIIKRRAAVAAGKPMGAPGQPNGGMQPMFNPDMPPNNGVMTPADIAAAEAEAYKDRITGEDMRKDWEFTVVFAVMLDPPPFTPAPGAAPAAPGPTASAAPTGPQVAATP